MQLAQAAAKPSLRRMEAQDRRKHRRVSWAVRVRGLTGERETLHLEYEAYPGMAERVLQQIADEVCARWPDIRQVSIVHRVGQLQVGDTAIVIALSASHRAQTFDALHYAIDRVKEIAPIWQQEIWRKLTQNREFRGHALLLKGKKGIGKYEFARHLAKSLLCTAPTAEREACGKCLSCGWFEQSSHPNFYLVMPEALTVKPGEHSAAG